MKWRNSKERELLSSKVPQLYDDNDIITAYPIADSSTREPNTSALSVPLRDTSTVTHAESAVSIDNNNIELKDSMLNTDQSGDMELEPISDCESESANESDDEDHLEID